MRLSAANLKQHAYHLGFNLVGITRAEPSPTLSAYHRWIAAGMQGEMGYLARPDRVIRREALTNILPGVQSLVMVGLDYSTAAVPAEVLADPSRGRIAAYAWGMDYHDIMTPRLEALADWLNAESGAHRVYVDTGAILERSHAQQAGMGFIGKNTMLIHPHRGSYFFLGEILLTLEFDVYDTPHRETMCGRCTRCLNACPTDAFPQPHVLDARRCISYHTIENKGVIDRDLRPKFGNWIYGCDICQEVCPFQRFAPSGAEAAFLPVDFDRAAPPLVDMLTLTDAEFKRRFEGSPVYRIKRERLVRNACIAAGNSANPRLIPALRNLLADDSPLIRGHAADAFWRLAGSESVAFLKAHYQREENAGVRAEIATLLV
jgi:epoxyqueuosine reductase